ncbi:flagellar biosynthetic protein FliR [Actinoplanes sp. NBRC 14428]|uniref:Flagellar biosynthetic protein FliR n=1 Tax=Pseudosporangium ferrugineum TaxID=439699 RepID=A0A2T0S5P5_9ACTN|nr:flagellar biosynthetic protein FliR [Pseudosporangium ferrugineum]PRY28735.1 flagellar biosynthetic protein FliR [Pseudosporangium ferrugineum]BCJ53804.1 flagellar biosynthetic protein FliR [Actinoplanes sp. NBRC 14428]
MNAEVPIAELVAIFLGAARAGAWLMLCPPFSSRLIPGQVKVLLSVGIALPMAPYLTRTLPSTETSAIIAATALQVFVGAALGFITYLLFAAVQAAGDMIDVFGGFTLATAYDPMSQNQSSVFGRFYNLVATTLLFASDGHQLVLRGFMESYKTLPLDASFSMETFSRLLTEGIGEMFVSALQIAGPLIAVLFLTDVAFGLLNRVAPALNAFQLGFPAKIFLVLTLSGTAIAILPRALDGIIDNAVRAVVHLSGGG